ncbi:dimethylsulfonioproprionate lyase family protein [Frigidibacter sp. MR17.14]|uniref:dimethylsulfonioproprionate lyase family protein n=1 Tax=Frigidibacter sp. MR17.14 TaxID=3126509 RepID=UPI003012B557
MADWSALVAAFAATYRAAPDGGSAAIRAHVDTVLARIAGAGREAIATTPRSLPVTAHLPRALDLGAAGPMAPLATALGAVAGDLTWEYGYKEMPADLARDYGYCEILGPRGPLPCPDLILGFVLFAPGAVYPEHAHPGISESYLSVAEHWSQNDAGLPAPGSLVFNAPGTPHRITVGRDAPCLLGWAWTGAPDRLAAPGMVLNA